jgi:zinc transporter ZupT
VVIVIGTLASTIGYTVLSNTSPPIISISIAFAAGAILVMLGEFIIPESFRKEGFGKGIALLAGFLVALILTKAQGGCRCITKNLISTAFTSVIIERHQLVKMADK